MIVLVMGVSGSGKTTLGGQLAARLGWRFLDADDFHPPENVAKMAAGIPLTDEDRAPWLARLNQALKNETDAVLACSALKQKYREMLLQGISESKVVFLSGSRETIGKRLVERKHRYMPASLLESQFAALESPLNAIEVDVAQDPERCVEHIAKALR